MGRTETIYDNLNPVFVTNIEVDYKFEEQQTFLIEAYDMDDNNQPENLKAQEYIGKLEFQLHQVVTGRDQTLVAPLENSERKDNGKIKITGEEKKMSASNQLLLIQLKGNLQTRDYVFFILWKQLSPGQYKPVYKSEIKIAERGHQNWNQFKIDTQTLCNEDDKQEIKIDFYRYDSAGSHKMIGQDFTDLSELSSGKNEFKCKNDTVQIV